MKKTISFMAEKGSGNHNGRKFHAKNIEPQRSYLNVEYCNEILRMYITNYLMKRLNAIIRSRRGLTAGLTIIMKKSVLTSRRKYSMRLSCKSGISTTWELRQKIDDWHQKYWMNIFNISREEIPH